MDHEKTETLPLVTLEKLAKTTENAAHHVGIINVDVGTVKIVHRENCNDPDVGQVVDWSMPTISIEGGAPTYGRIHLPLPAPWELSCENCSKPARVILTQRLTKKDAPIHPRCQDHLAPGCAKTIDGGVS